MSPGRTRMRLKSNRSHWSRALCFWASSLLLTTASYADEALPPEPPLVTGDRSHWSFKPLERPALPQIEPIEAGDPNRDWPRNAIDLFILDRLHRANLRPALEADRVTLIRRLSFNLTGLPPQSADVAAFVDDRSVEAYERLVERLLSSPAYGERWGQHWLDVARFAETDGFEHDKLRPDAYRFRDWVIAALNDDLPYDQFVTQQLAGDEFGTQTRVATGFLTCGPDMPDLNRQDERRTVFMNDLAGTVGSVFMGLQLGCAQCHDHKYDPVSQHDFYRLRAFFESAFDFKRDVPMALPSGNRAAVQPPFLIRGDFRRPVLGLEPAFLRVVTSASQSPQIAANKSNQRSELAHWLTRADHPLTTRTIANRVWQFHFGSGLSDTPSDLGLVGDTPLHLDLLNWLATELPRRQWSLKELHRLIVTSSTYRQSSRLPSGVESVRREQWQRASEYDPSVRLHSRARRQRLEGEALRDAMLSVSGRLNDRRNGPGIRPPLPPEVVQSLLKSQWTVTEDPTDWSRRSIYLFVRRNLRYPFFEAFDKPDSNVSCPRRNRSTAAPQALVLLNSELSFELAAAFAEDVRAGVGSARNLQLRTIYRRALGRLPSDEEQAAGIEFLGQAPASGKDDKLADYCLAVFNLNEFLYVD